MKIYADYLAYLLKRTEEFLREATGYDVWPKLKHRAEIVFSHPNRWGTEQQKFLEKAAIQAGLVTREGARRYLHFVEEVEAVASFALSVDVTLDLQFEVHRNCIRCHLLTTASRIRMVPSLSHATLVARTVDISTHVVTNRTLGRLDVEELDVPSCEYEYSTPAGGTL